MPIGSYAAVPWLADTLLRRRPRSVLDLGIGFGGGGVAVREWLDLGVRPWKTYLVGVEVWCHYRNPVWDLYNAVHVQSIEQFLATNREQFDAVILGDVLEHFEKSEGGRILNVIKTRVAPQGCFLVATPAIVQPQAAVYGNTWECHRSQWTPDDLERAGFTVVRVGCREFACGECLCAIWSR